MSIVPPCSKKRKHLGKVGDFWRRKAESYKSGSDEAPEMDSQDSEDHDVQPTDPNAVSYTKRKQP